MLTKRTKERLNFSGYAALTSTNIGRNRWRFPSELHLFNKWVCLGPEWSVSEAHTFRIQIVLFSQQSAHGNKRHWLWSNVSCWQTKQKNNNIRYWSTDCSQNARSHNWMDKDNACSLWEVLCRFCLNEECVQWPRSERLELWIKIKGRKVPKLKSFGCVVLTSPKKGKVEQLSIERILFERLEVTGLLINT